MARKSGPPPIVYILLVIAVIWGGWQLFKRNSVPLIVNPDHTPESQPPQIASAPLDIPAPDRVAPGTIVRVDGSTSMVTLNANLKAGFEARFPETLVQASASGSSKGIEALIGGRVDVAASSRELTPQEQGQGLVAVPVALDRIAIVVGIGNTVGQTLSAEQVRGIFQGQIVNWSEVGGPNLPIRVLNRPPESGTRQSFQEVVLQGQDFGAGPTITTLDRDATTPMLQALGNDGIGYATAAQVLNQSTVRVVAIDGVTPMADSYPFARALYYVYRDPLRPTSSAFLGYALSPEGRQQMLAP